MKTILFLFISLAMQPVFAQEAQYWTEDDRQYLLEHLKRTRGEMIQETQNLTTQQWNFRESPDRWSINEIVEHVALWELLLQREISQALWMGPQPELAAAAKPDSSYLSFILEEKPHYSVDYTEPFTFTLPMGLHEGDDNLAWFLKLRDESTLFVEKTTGDLRASFMKEDRPNVHQIYIYAFGHADRHLRQIRKVKEHPDYPQQTAGPK